MSETFLSHLHQKHLRCLLQMYIPNHILDLIHQNSGVGSMNLYFYNFPGDFEELWLRMRTSSLKNSYSEETLYSLETQKHSWSQDIFSTMSLWYTLINFGKCCIFSNILLLNHENFIGTFQKFHNAVLFWKTL